MRHHEYDKINALKQPETSDPPAGPVDLLTNRSPARKIRELAIRRLNGPEARDGSDFLAAEDPLEIRVEGRSVAVVMRTPGDDYELAAGFLATEGLIRQAGDLKEIRHQMHCQALVSKNKRRTSRPGGITPHNLEGNVINVRVTDSKSVDFKKLTRHIFTSSSCGICSKASIAAVQRQFPSLDDASQADPRMIMRLPEALSQAQETFKQTGGLHACALFDLSGKLLVAREDVGRHNALDKVIGWALLAGRLPLAGHILLLSGRASFEMMQKALAGGISIVAAVSAPSSLAAEFARASGQVLIGFLRGERMNVYAGAGRIAGTNLKPSAPVQTLLVPVGKTGNRPLPARPDSALKSRHEMAC